MNFGSERVHDEKGHRLSPLPSKTAMPLDRRANHVSAFLWFFPVTCLTMVQCFPPSVSKIDSEGFEVFMEGAGGDEALVKELMYYCKRGMDSQDNGKAHYCEGLRTRGFDKFVRSVSKQMPQYKDTVEDIDEWERRCRRRADAPPTCVALSYFMLPIDFRSMHESVKDNSCKNSDAPEAHNQTEKQKKNMEFLALTVETHTASLKHCSLIRTASASGVEFEVLGTHYRGVMGHTAKINLLKNRINLIPASKRKNTLLLFTDSRDVIVQASSDFIINGFLRSGVKVLFNAEGNCYPYSYFPLHMMLGDNTHSIPHKAEGRFNGYHICGKLFADTPGRPGSPRWLNSGAFVGYADAVLEILEAIQNAPTWFIERYPGSDQGFFMQAYLSQKFGIGIDTCSHIFTSIATHDDYSEHHPWGDMFLYAHGPHRRNWNVLYAAEKKKDQESEKTAPYGNFSLVWRNKATGKVAPIIHLNGQIKAYFSPNKVKRHRMRPEFHIFVDGPCSVVKRFEATMFVAGSHVVPGTQAWENRVAAYELARFHDVEGDSDLEYDALLEQCHQGWEILADACSFANETVQHMKNAKTSGLGFFLEFSPLRMEPRIDVKAHVQLAKATFAATSAIEGGPTEYLNLIEGRKMYLMGRSQKLIQKGAEEVIDHVVSEAHQKALAPFYFYFIALPVAFVASILTRSRHIVSVARRFATSRFFRAHVLKIRAS
mmetsp:Transcript_42464/g.70822  ORF Transcript_42464/g.70822 Transcript_42464/m.70822 type:complete len:713 (+) Transcript_42464:178-2316(+)